MKAVKSSMHHRETLLESDVNYDRIAQYMPVAVYATDQDGLITYYNQKAVELWGRKPRLNDPTELLYCGSWKLFEPDGRSMPHHKCPMAKALRFQRSFRNKEIHIKQPNGNQIAALVNIDPIFGADGKLKGAVNVFYDITERNRVEDETRRLAAIVESSEDSIISKTLDGTITSWNQSAAKIFGYTEEEAIGQPISIIIPPSGLEEERIIIEKILKGEQTKSFNTIRIAKNGKKKNVSLTVSPIKNSMGEVIGASRIARDISEQVRIQRRLKSYNKKLKKLNKYKDDFVGMVCHELKTPLTIIKGFLQLVELNVQLHTDKSFISKSLFQVDRLTSLVSDLTEVSKAQSNKLQLSFSTFNINELIDECIESIQLANSSYQFVREGINTNLIVTADRQRIEQVLINLISNAIKYSPGQDRVILKTIASKNAVIVSVQDFGIGIKSNYLKKVFSRFFRVEEQVGNFSGLGIGLYISKEIITRHQGKIWAESELEQGSTFYFKIPLSQ